MSNSSLHMQAITTQTIRTFLYILQWLGTWQKRFCSLKPVFITFLPFSFYSVGVKKVTFGIFEREKKNQMENYIFFFFCTWDDYHIFLIATLVFTRLLIDETYHLIELLFDWLIMWPFSGYQALKGLTFLELITMKNDPILDKFFKHLR